MILTFTVPDDAPSNVVVTNVTSSSVLISWSPPSTPNGIITHYTIYVNYTDGSGIFTIQTESSATSYTLTDLQPYQSVIVQVSASTAVGEGPVSETAEGRPHELGTGALTSNVTTHTLS